MGPLSNSSDEDASVTCRTPSAQLRAASPVPRRSRAARAAHSPRRRPGIVADGRCGPLSLDNRLSRLVRADDDDDGMRMAATAPPAISTVKEARGSFPARSRPTSSASRRIASCSASARAKNPGPCCRATTTARSAGPEPVSLRATACPFSPKIPIPSGIREQYGHSATRRTCFHQRPLHPPENPAAHTLQDRPGGNVLLRGGPQEGYPSGISC